MTFDGGTLRGQNYCSKYSNTKFIVLWDVLILNIDQSNNHVVFNHKNVFFLPKKGKACKTCLTLLIVSIFIKKYHFV
jgi:hypothetical protein